MFRKTFWNFASQLLGLAVSFGDRFVLAAILLRAWPTDLYADWTTISACAGLLGLADFGFVVYIGNRFQRTFALNDDSGFIRAVGFSTFMYAALAFAMLLILLGLTVVELVHPFLSVRALAPSQGATVLALLGLTQIVHSAKSSISQIYRGRGRFARGVVIDSFCTFGITATTIVIALCGVGPAALALAYVGAHLVFGWGILLTDIHRNFGNVALTPLWPQTNELREAARAMSWYSIGYALPLVWVQTPVLMLSAFGLGGLALVSFVTLRTLINFCRSFSAMLSTSAGVELAAHVHAGDIMEVERGLAVIARLVGITGGVMVGGALTFGGPVIEIWTGKTDLLDIATLFWLAVPSITVAPALPLLYLAQLADIPKPIAKCQAAQAAMAIALGGLLVGRFGSAGLALSLIHI